MDIIDASQWRSRFNALVNDVYRELEAEPPYLTQELDEPVTLGLVVDGIDFDITHDADFYPEQLLVECQFSPIPADQTATALTKLLEANLMLVHADQDQARFGIDAEHNAIVHSSHLALGATDVRSLFEVMERIAPWAQQWQQSCFLDQAAAPSISDPISYQIAIADFSYRKQFIALVEDICVELGHTVPPHALDKEEKEELVIEIEVNDVRFMILHSNTCQPQRTVVECRHGRISDENIENMETVLQQLLKLNHFLAEDGKLTFGIDGKTREVVCTYAGDLADEDGVKLLNVMEQLSCLDGMWK